MTRPSLLWTVAAWVMLALLNARLVDEALAVGLMFSAYRRPSEAMGIREDDLVDPGPNDQFHAVNLFPDEGEACSKVGAANDPHPELAGPRLAGDRVGVTTMPQRRSPEDLPLRLREGLAKGHRAARHRPPEVRAVPTQARWPEPRHEVPIALRGGHQDEGAVGERPHDEEVRGPCAMQRELANFSPADLAEAQAAEADLPALAQRTFRLPRVRSFWAAGTASSKRPLKPTKCDSSRATKVRRKRRN